MINMCCYCSILLFCHEEALAYVTSLKKDLILHLALYVRLGAGVIFFARICVDLWPSHFISKLTLRWKYSKNYRWDNNTFHKI